MLKKKKDKNANITSNKRHKLKSKITSKVSNVKNKKLIAFSTILALGIALIPFGIGFGLNSEKYTNPQIVKQKFPTVLLSVKNTVESKFQNLIDDMKEDPLNGLFVDKLPTPEEIFFEEWANDWFPDIDIPTVGGYIESVGAKAVGDIDLDGKYPFSDLNITSSSKPSGMLYNQCKALWDPQNINSLVSKSPSIWFSALGGNSDDQIILNQKFNLTSTQLSYILTWINVSQNTWLPNLAKEDRLMLNPLIFFGLLSGGIVLIGLSTPKVRKEIKSIRSESKKELKPKETSFKNSE